MSDDNPNELTSNGRYEPTDEDRRRDAMYQAVNIHGQCGDPDLVIASAAKFAAFIKGA